MTKKINCKKSSIINGGVLHMKIKLNFVVLILSMFVWFTGTKPCLSQNEDNVKDIFILSDIGKGTIEVRLFSYEQTPPKIVDGTADVVIIFPDKKEQKVDGIKLQSVPDKSYLSFTTTINPVVLWHPNTPNLYNLKIVVKDKDGKNIYESTERFGMRKLETRNAKFYVNNKPFWFRACGHEYEQWEEDLDEAGIRKRLQQKKNYGFNAIRHHSHVPQEKYLKIADELGIFIQMEISGKRWNGLDSNQFKQSEKDWVKMITRGRKHPSTFIYGMGNEIYDNNKGLIECLDKFYSIAKEIDPSVLVLNRSGSNPDNDNHGKFDLIERPIGEYEHTAEFARDAFMLYLRGNRKGRCDEFPIIAHEYPLVCSYPNPALASKYKEEPYWIKKTVDNAKKHGTEHLLPRFVKSSEAIQAVCRREMLEEARKFRELDGYSMLRFTDFTFRVSGVVDDFSDPKNVSAEEFLKTNGETVLLCTWPKRNFKYGEDLEAVLEISHHGQEPYSAAKCKWQLKNGDTVLKEGLFENIKVDAVDVAEVGKIQLKIPVLSKPAKLILHTEIVDSNPRISNDWPIWAFSGDTIDEKQQSKVLVWDPNRRMRVYANTYEKMEYNTDKNWVVDKKDTRLIITDSWQNTFYEFLDNGGKIWVISDKTFAWPQKIGIFGIHYVTMLPGKQAPSIFPELDETNNAWLTICSNSEARDGNSGTVVNDHVALKNFPNDGFCDMQFWTMVHRAKSLHLDKFPAGTTPLIHSIDNYNRGYNKGYMVELQVGKGKLFINTLNITNSFQRDVAAQYVFDQMLRYLLSSDWKPDMKMTQNDLMGMVKDFAISNLGKSKKKRESSVSYNAAQKDDKETIILNIYDAKDIDKQTLDVHFEYAMTQWFVNAAKNNSYEWNFTNNTEGDFTGTLFLAGTLKNVMLTVQIDDKTPVEVKFTGSDNWNQFLPVTFDITGLTGNQEHKIVLSIPESNPLEEGKTVRIRDIELKKK